MSLRLRENPGKVSAMNGLQLKPYPLAQRVLDNLRRSVQLTRPEKKEENEKRYLTILKKENKALKAEIDTLFAF